MVCGEDDEFGLGCIYDLVGFLCVLYLYIKTAIFDKLNHFFIAIGWPQAAMTLGKGHLPMVISVRRLSSCVMVAWPLETYAHVSPDLEEGAESTLFGM